MVIDTTPHVRKCFEEYRDTIIREVLASEVKFEATEGEEWDLNGERAVIALEKQ
jgi:hypothetical protein